LAFLALLGSSTPLWAAEPHKKIKSINENKTEAFNSILKGSLTLLIISALLYLGIKDGGYFRYIGSSLYNIYEGIYSYLPAGVGKRIAFFVLVIFSLLPFLGTVFFLTLGRSYLKKDEIYNVPIIGDLADLVKRTGWMALLVFAIVVSYRISDTTMGVMAMPLYIDLGYSKAVIGGVKGIFGISMLIFGAFAGSWSVAKIGMSKTMIFGAFVTIFTNLNFAWLATVSTPNTIYLFSTIGADNLAAGFSGSVFIAFMSILVNKKYSASQYALFSSLFALYGKSLAAFSGVLADKVDYVWFFVLTSVLGVPALIFVLYAWLNGFTDSINEDAVAKSCL
jgi:PAT family beta-lactamase induction signal transducer AmpG